MADWTEMRSGRIQADVLRRYQRAVHLRQRAWSVLSIPFDAYWLGMLDPDDLARIDEAFYGCWREALAGAQVLYSDDAWNDSGLHSWETSMIDAHFPTAGRLCVTAAGGGREVLALLAAGHDAVGYEANGGLRESGRQLLARRGHQDRLRPVTRDEFPADVGACDGVVVGWGSYHSIPGRARRVRFLEGARSVLEPGSPVLLSFFTRDPARRAMPLIARLANVVRALRRAEPVEEGDLLNPNLLHFFTREEIVAELAAAGFALRHFDSEPYGHAVGVAA